LDAPLNRRQELGEIPPSHVSRLRFLAESDRSVIATIGLGVLFVIAFWSGPSRKAFAELKRVLAKTDPSGRLEFVVVDTDGCPDLYEAPEFVGKIHGYGETAWIKDGKIVCTADGHHSECFEDFTHQLLM
jgi:hypothetical protein